MLCCYANQNNSKHQTPRQTDDDNRWLHLPLTTHQGKCHSIIFTVNQIPATLQQIKQQMRKESEPSLMLAITHLLLLLLSISRSISVVLTLAFGKIGLKVMFILLMVTLISSLNLIIMPSLSVDISSLLTRTKSRKVLVSHLAGHPKALIPLQETRKDL